MTPGLQVTTVQSSPRLSYLAAIYESQYPSATPQQAIAYLASCQENDVVALEKAALEGRNDVLGHWHPDILSPIPTPLQDAPNEAAKTPPRTPRDDGMTVLHLASLSGDSSVVITLLESGVDISARTLDGRTALHIASSGGREKVVLELLRAGADVSSSTEDGRTALHLAASSGHEKIVELLLERGADLSVQDKVGITALHEASWNGFEKIVDILLRAGADMRTQDQEGMTAMHLALWNGHNQIIQLLQDAGPDLASRGSLRVRPVWDEVAARYDVRVTVSN